MEDGGGDCLNMFCLEKIWQNYVSFAKEYSLYGIIGALLLAVISPLIFSSINAHKTKNRKRAVPVDAGGEPGLTMRNSRFSSLIQFPWDGATTVAALFEQVCEKHSKDRSLGMRKLISREVVESGNGRKFEKLHLGEYVWQTYGLTFERACSFASGLIKMGHERDSHVAIFSDTRAEWFIAAQGCFRQNITVVTIYASLGEDALVHSLNETQVSTLICDFKQLKKLPAISSRLPSIKRKLRVLENKPCRSNTTFEHRCRCCNVYKRKHGLPKGSHDYSWKYSSHCCSCSDYYSRFRPSDVYMAYLPLAHVFELAAEVVMFSAGCAIGYSSALTMTDTSNKIKRGTKGDASVLKPTLMITVPAILDRIRDGVLKKVEEKGGVAKKLFNVGYKRRLMAIDGKWLGAWDSKGFCGITLYSNQYAL
uniref:AMP-dependent synthetase/ligase domain-containing protein n=1 Tax=Ananas comosus var. bracteatus TaxID=296719 RepID=A0A6V7Q863_ANACO|nr:unnamed protein product [Ananas comosus var. bracteatus]